MTDGRERQSMRVHERERVSVNETRIKQNEQKIKEKRICVCYVRNTECVSVLLLYFASLRFAFLVYFLHFFIVYLSSAFCLVWFHWHQAPVYLGAVLVNTHTHTLIAQYYNNINRIQNNTTNAGALFLFVFICVCFILSVVFACLFPYTQFYNGKKWTTTITGEQSERRKKMRTKQNRTWITNK